MKLTLKNTTPTHLARLTARTPRTSRIHLAGLVTRFTTLAATALVAVLAHAGPAAAQDLVFYNDQAQFEQKNVDLGNAQKGVEDFEESVLPPGFRAIIDDPLESGVPNGFFPNGLEGLRNIQIQSNVLGSDPFKPAPFGPNGLLALADGASGVTSDVVVHNFAEHSYDIILLDEFTMSVGFNPVAFSGGQVSVKVYDTANNFLGETLFNADDLGSKFAGVISTVPIGRINIFDPVRGGGDNIQKWVYCPQIQNITQGTFHCTIQDAIDEAASVFQDAGDEIVVQEGTYFENINFLGKAITLRSTDPTDPAVVAATIIDAGGSGRVVLCNSGEGPDTVLSGFTITGGNAPNGAGMQNGAGSSPTVTYCTFIDNAATNNGGGMRNVNNSSPTVTNCTFSGNSATYGAGMRNTGGSPTVTNCTFSGNSAAFGGGMENYDGSSPTVTNCTFSGNMATIIGGGMDNYSSSSPTVTNCMFSGNDANSGGGMSNDGQSNSTVINCTFSGNSASDGGGMWNYYSSPTVTNCTFSGNTANINGGGVYNVTGSNPTVTNCILWGDSPDEIFNSSSSSRPTVTYSNVQGGFAGIGNINADPMFVDADGPDDIPGNEDDDLRLLADSPCIDAGDNDAVLATMSTDLDGNPRFVDDAGVADTGNPGSAGLPVVDMGAFEWLPLCLADIAPAGGDGMVNVSDLLTLLGAWGTPGADITGDGLVNVSDLLMLLAAWGVCP